MARQHIVVGALVVLAACGKRDAAVDVIARVFPQQYALADMKTRRFGWNAEAELATLRKRVRSSRDRTRAVFDFFAHLHDLHARPILAKNDAVWLGFHLERIDDGSYRVAWVDGASELTVGDEVIAFDGVPIERAIVHTIVTTGWDSTPAFASRMATKLLVYRARSDWGTIPRDGQPVTLKVRHDRQEREVTLVWRDDLLHPPTRRCPYWSRDPQGIVPPLGRLVWQQANAYIFEHGDHVDGYVRYPSYVDDKSVLHATGIALAAFNQQGVRAVVIDQTGNGGGNFIFGYLLLSHFLAESIDLPRQRFIVENGVVAGFPQDQGMADASFFQQFADERPERHLSRLHNEGFDRIEPVAHAFAGPVVMLTSALDVSAAEYVAAALHDSGRAKLIGETTAGGGGDQRVVRDKKLRALGIDGFTYTVTVGVRSNGRPIENIGVEPDIEHKLTLRDLTEHGADYAKSVLENLP